MSIFLTLRRLGRRFTRLNMSTIAPTHGAVPKQLPVTDPYGQGRLLAAGGWS